MKKKIAVLTACRSIDFIKSFIEGMKRATKDKNIDIYIFTYHQYDENSGFSNKTGANIFSLVDYKNYDGIILLSHLFPDLELLENIRADIVVSQVPAISVNIKLEGLDFVNCNSQEGFSEALNHLIKVHNVKKLCYIGGAENEILSKTRLETFKKIIAENNIPEDSVKYFLKGNWSYAYGKTTAEKIFENIQNLPDAIVCANDFTAVSIISLAKKYRISIPEQLKLIGYDNLKIAEDIYPGITSVNNNAEEAGYESVLRLINCPAMHNDIILQTKAFIRQSCGCNTEATLKQLNALPFYYDDNYTVENFAFHIRQIEDVFLDSTDVYSLLTNLESYFAIENYFEGQNFTIFLKSDWSSILINTEEELPENSSFGNQVQSIVNIHEGYKYPNEIINIDQLLPQNMKNEASSVFLFMPIYNHTYIHGYYVAKDSLNLLYKKYSLLWTRNLGSCIERFRQKNMYKHMSQQFLKLSTHDALSGMLNRIGMDKIGEPFYKKNQSEKLTNILLFADINSMKTINDKFGHLHGDLAVKTVADAILQVIPKTWCGIRYGGDEFLVIGNNKDYHGEDFCQLITNIIEKKNVLMQLPYKLSASLGFFTVPSTTQITLAQAISKVDEAMYLKKQAYHKEHPQGN